MKKLSIVLLVLFSLSLYGSDFDEVCKIVRSNDSINLEPLLQNEKNIQLANKQGRTLLFCASETGAYKSALLLLEKGIDPNARDDENRTALQLLLEWRRGDHFDDVKTALVLLEHNANVNHEDKYGNPLLMQASNPEMIRLLLSYGADMTRLDNEGNSALFHFAKGSYNQKAEIINVLVEFGADLTEKDKEGKRAFDYMTPNDQYTLCGTVDDAIEIDEKKIINWLRDAIKDHNYKLVERFLKMGNYVNAKDSYYKKPFVFYAISDARMIGLFLDHGLDVNSTYERNPGYAQGYSRSLLQEAIKECAVESVRLLLEHQKKIQDDYKTLASLLRCDDNNKSVEIVDMLLNKGVAASAADNKGHTLLHLAAREGRGELCQFFIEHGVDVNLKDKEGVSPLLYALTADNDSCTRVLLKSEVDIHTKDPKGVGVLQAAISKNNLELVGQLLKKGLNPNEVDQAGHTAMMMAARKGNLDIMKLLLKKGANISMVDTDGKGALHHACRYNGSVDVVQFLLEQSLDINIETKKGQTPLWVSAEFDNLSIAKYLIEHGANINVQDGEGNSPLHRAAKRGRKKIIALLLLNGANKELKNKEGLDALELAVKKHSYDKETYQNIFSGKYGDLLLDQKHIFSFNDINDILLYAANGGDLNIRNENNNSLLHIASEKYGDVKTVKYLLAAGLDPNWKNKAGRTPLHIAAQHHREQVVHILLQQGASLAVKDKQGMMPVDLAIVDISSHQKDLLVILSDMFHHGLKSIPVVSAKGWPLLNDAVENPKLLTFLIDKGLDVNAMGNNGKTPLIICAIHDYFESAKILLASKADPNISGDRDTALYAAVELGNYRVAELLLKYGVDTQIKTKDGDVPLLNAVREGKLKMLSLLLKYQADPNISDKDGNSALSLAVGQMSEEMVKLLLEYKADANREDDMGWKPLDYAKKLKLKKIIALLEPVTAIQKDIKPHAIISIEGDKKPDKNISSAKTEDENVAKYEQSKLHQAVSSQNLDAVKDLLENHAEVDIVDILGRTPLHYAAIRDYAKIAELLLDKGANINAVDQSKQWTPLFFATFMNHREMVELLIEKGADQTVKDKLNKTVADYKKNQKD